MSDVWVQERHNDRPTCNPLQILFAFDKGKHEGQLRGALSEGFNEAKEVEVVGQEDSNAVLLISFHTGQSAHWDLHHAGKPVTNKVYNVARKLRQSPWVHGKWSPGYKKEVITTCSSNAAVKRRRQYLNILMDCLLYSAIKVIIKPYTIKSDQLCSISKQWIRNQNICGYTQTI